MAASTRGKKSVSFSNKDSFDRPGEKDDSFTADFEEETTVVTKGQNDGSLTDPLDSPVANPPCPVPEFPASLLAVPFHLPAFAYTLFTVFDINTDPLKAMHNSLLSLIPLQSIYLTLVNQLIVKPHIQSSKKQSKKKQSASSSQNNQLQSISLIPTSGDFLYMGFSLLISLCAAFPIFIIIILYGAPVSTLILESIYLSLHVSLLTVYPALIIYPVVSSSLNKSEQVNGVWSSLLTFQVGPRLYKHQLYVSIVGAIVGTWLGVIPIPLDWDRPWQAWPITLLVGGYLGSFVASLISYLANLVL